MVLRPSPPQTLYFCNVTSLNKQSLWVRELYTYTRTAGCTLRKDSIISNGCVVVLVHVIRKKVSHFGLCKVRNVKNANKKYNSYMFFIIIIYVHFGIFLFSFIRIVSL